MIIISVISKRRATSCTILGVEGCRGQALLGSSPAIQEKACKTGL